MWKTLLVIRLILQFYPKSKCSENSSNSFHSFQNFRLLRPLVPPDPKWSEVKETHKFWISEDSWIENWTRSKICSKRHNLLKQQKCSGVSHPNMDEDNFKLNQYESSRNPKLKCSWKTLAATLGIGCRGSGIYPRPGPCRNQLLCKCTILAGFRGSGLKTPSPKSCVSGWTHLTAL